VEAAATTGTDHNTAHLACNPSRKTGRKKVLLLRAARFIQTRTADAGSGICRKERQGKEGFTGLHISSCPAPPGLQKTTSFESVVWVSSQLPARQLQVIRAIFKQRLWGRFGQPKMTHHPRSLSISPKFGSPFHPDSGYPLPPANKTENLPPGAPGRGAPLCTLRTGCGAPRRHQDVGSARFRRGEGVCPGVAPSRSRQAWALQI
jgi:hypothetical protein